jgi:hypothetical protein
LLVVDFIPFVEFFFTAEVIGMVIGDLFVAAINVLGVTLFTVGGASVLFILLLYLDTLHHIMKNASPLIKTHSAFVLSVYPVSCMYCGIQVQQFTTNTSYILMRDQITGETASYHMMRCSIIYALHQMLS